MYISIPTYQSQENKWSYTDFKTRDDFKDFVQSKFLPPGEVKLYNTNMWNAEARRFDTQGYYCNAPFKSKDYMKYWGEEKEKCTKGVIIDDFYLSRYYYFWINFLPINDKEVNKLRFPKVWDSQYYFFLYIQLCDLNYKYDVVVKKRQWGGTFQHLAILLNDVWFEQGFINKIGASDEEYLKADWAMLEEYRTFLNTHTEWYRQFNPDKILNWQQRIEVKQAGRKSFKGNSSILKGLNFKISPTKGVGGKNNKFYYEEAGITKTMTKTFEYIDPALKLGALTTGMFMASGSVGELEQCEDLKKMAFNPTAFNVFSIRNIFEENPEILEICFFVPEYWSMPPFIDRDGNSLVEEAKAWCVAERNKIKTSKSPEDYRMYVSQHPFSLGEAFAWRKEAIFSQAKLLRQQERIMIDGDGCTPVELDTGAESSKITHKITDKPYIKKFPLGDNDSKESSIQVWEWPPENPKPLVYFAGVDPVMTDKTTTSVSLFSVYIFKNLVETTYTDNGVTKIKLDGYCPVAAYTGRYDEMKKNNEIAEYLIRWYNALAAVENNAASFINHMQQRGLQYHLATKDQLSFISELKTNKEVYSPYGFKMNDTIKTYFVDMVKEYINEVLDEIKTHEDKIVKTVYGVERIRDFALLEELKQFHYKLNVDRFVSFAAGLALMKSYRKYGLGVSKIDETKKTEEHIVRETGDKASFFRHYGNILYTNQGQQVIKPNRNFFKNFK